MPRLLRNACLAAALFSAGCASSKGVVPLRTFTPTPAPAMAEHIGPGDLVAVRVWNSEQMTAKQRVRPDGTLVLFFIDSLPVVGLTPTAVSAEIARRLEGVFVAPRVSVVVEESEANAITLLGEVQRPGTYHIARPLTVLEGLALASGLTEYARHNRIFVLRETAGPNGPSRVRIQVRYDELLRGDDRARGLVLRAGDVVVVE